MAPRTLKIILFIVNSNDRLTEEFVGHASTTQNKMGKHLVLIDVNKTSSEALRPTFPKILLKALKNFAYKIK